MKNLKKILLVLLMLLTNQLCGDVKILNTTMVIDGKETKQRPMISNNHHSIEVLCIDGYKFALVISSSGSVDAEQIHDIDNHPLKCDKD